MLSACLIGLNFSYRLFPSKARKGLSDKATKNRGLSMRATAQTGVRCQLEVSRTAASHQCSLTPAPALSPVLFVSPLNDNVPCKQQVYVKFCTLRWTYGPQFWKHCLWPTDNFFYTSKRWWKPEPSHFQQIVTAGISMAGTWELLKSWVGRARRWRRICFCSDTLKKKKTTKNKTIQDTT